MRQRLSDKVSGHMVGVWLLVAEHLRLGTWDLLRSWSQASGERAEPRLAMQLVHEAAICTTGVRSDRTLTNRGGFELANGLPFVASDTAIHDLLASHTVENAIGLQVMLGKIRRAKGDYCGKVLAIDPHRMRSYSKRNMRMHAKKASGKPIKMAQTFWLLDADTHQPVCFTTATSSRTVPQVSPEILDLAEQILPPPQPSRLLLADTEYFSAELLDDVARRKGFEIIVPMPNTKALRTELQAISPHAFTPRWAGYATGKQPFEFKKRSQQHPYYQYIQRNGERPEQFSFKAYLSTTDADEVHALTHEYPKRWHIEEFFNANQELGWKRAGTMNLNIRYGQMTMALVAQAAIHQLRTRIGEPISSWDANHLAKDLFLALDGDVRVHHDTIIVTYYNAPNAQLLRSHYEKLPEKLQREHIDPRIPWLYNFKLDFRFR